MSWFDVLAALKAARNYGAKVGGVISGNLGRGVGGRFTRVGSGGEANAAKPNTAKRGDVLAAAGISEAEAKALEDFLAGKKVDEDTLAGLYDKGLIDYTSDEKPLANANGRALAKAIKKGDVRKATDAVGRGGDKAKKRSNASKPKPAKAGGGKASKPKAPKPKPDTRVRDTERLGKAANRVEEIQARIENTRMGVSEQVRAENLLDEMTAEVNKLNVDQPERTRVLNAIAQARQALAKKREVPAIPIANAKGGFTVYKQADGVYRWIGYSSNAFEDREREVIPEAVLAADVERADAEGAYGPLRMWHIGEYEFTKPGDWQSVKAGPGFDIGDCDFNAMHGRILVESGTFKSKEIAEAVAPHAWQMSIGFSHPPTDPQGGVFNHARRFERSILPLGTAANAYTAFSVIQQKDESHMNQMKEKALRALLGDQYDAVAAVLKGAESIEQKALSDGVRHKSEDTEKAVDPASDPAATGTSADASAADAANASEDDDMSEGVGDMSVEELVAAILQSASFIDGLQQIVSKGLEPVSASVQKAIEAQATQNETATKELSQITALQSTIKELSERLAVLEGDAPQGVPGYVATQAADSVVVKSLTPETATNEIAALVDSFLNPKK